MYRLTDEREAALVSYLFPVGLPDLGLVTPVGPVLP